MKSIKKKIYQTLIFYGFDIRKFLWAVKHKKSRWYFDDLQELKRQKDDDTTFEFGRMWPILTDKHAEGGTMAGHYFHQDLHVAKLIHIANPQRHLDIGSRIDGFVAHVAAFREIEIIDIRPVKNTVANIKFRQANLIELAPELIEYCDSVSSLHAIEHFGLGRYGDPVDYNGHLKAIDNISRILISGGVFYFSAPIGPQRIDFNAHRVFSVQYLINILSDKFIIRSFSYVNDNGAFFEDIGLTEDKVNTNFGCFYGCGIFTCIKK